MLAAEKIKIEIVSREIKMDLCKRVSHHLCVLP